MSSTRVKDKSVGKVDSFLTMHGKLVAFVTGSIAVTSVVFTLGVKKASSDIKIDKLEKDNEKIIVAIDTLTDQNKRILTNFTELNSKLGTVIVNYSKHLEKTGNNDELISLYKELLEEVKKNEFLNQPTP